MKKNNLKLALTALLIGSLNWMNAQITLNASGGALTSTYTTVNAAFGAINAGTHTGTITILVTGNTLEGASGYTPTPLLASGQATANYAKITIKPQVTATISGQPAVGFGVLEMDGADNVTIDGTIGSGTTKNLTIENSNGINVDNTAAIRFIGKTTGGFGATFNVVKNCIIRGNTEGANGNNGSSAISVYGIYCGSNSQLITGSGGGIDYDNFSITNNSFERCYLGLYIRTSASTADGNMISNNTFGSNISGESLTLGAMGLFSVASSTVSQNQISNVFSNASINNYGIDIDGSGSGSILISRNNIKTISAPGAAGWGSYGINIVAGSNYTLVNNTISDIKTTNYSSTSTTWNAFGIRLGIVSNIAVHYNSVNMIGTYTYSGNSSAASSALCITSAAFTGTITNNIFSNTMNSTIATKVFSAIWMPAFTNYASVVINNNAYMVTNSPFHYVARNTTNYATLAAWKPIAQNANASNETASVPNANNGGAPFTSANNLTIPPNTITQIESGAALVATLGTNIDFNGAARPLVGVNPNTNPDMGAYELDGIVPAPCSGAPVAPVISGSNSTCGSAVNLTTTTSTLSGTNYQWGVSANSSGPFANLGTASVQNTGSISITLYYSVTSTCANSGSTTTSSVFTLNLNPTPTVTIAGPSSICASSSATLLANGAGTYSWSTGATSTSIAVSPTATTNYTVTGTSTLGCVNTKTYNLVVNALPTLSVASTASAICTGNSANLTVSGATTYTWNTGATTTSIVVSPTVSTTYTASGASALGCINTATYNLSVNALPTLSVVGTASAICTGNSANLTVSGAATYTWNTGATTTSIAVSPTLSTTYTVSGTSTLGCVNTKTYNLSVNALPTLSVVGTASAICTGNSANLTVSGAATYTWNTGATTTSIAVSPTVSTTYTVSGTSTLGCVNTKTYNLAVNATPTLNVVSTASLICVGSSVNLAASGAATYTWNTGATTPSITVSPTVSTTYTLSGTGSNGCTKITTIVQAVSACTSLKESITNYNTTNIQVYPNPSNDFVTVEFENATHELVQLQITNALGKVVLSESTATEKLFLNIHHLPNAIYFISIRKNNVVVSKKLIKN